jgi:H+/gluconate symporter-like permease
MWSRKVLFATMVAAAAVTLMRHPPSPSPLSAVAQLTSGYTTTSFR